jgi:hypothetical protein
MLGILFNACQEREKLNSNTHTVEEKKWNFEKLNNRAVQHLDSTQWDVQLLNQDIQTYTKYLEIFQSYPLNK